jgi:hypothetical protein
MDDIKATLDKLRRESELGRGKPNLIIRLSQTMGSSFGCMAGFSGADTVLSDRIIQTTVYHDLLVRTLGRKELRADETDELTQLVSKLNMDDKPVRWNRTIFCEHDLNASSGSMPQFSFHWPDDAENIPASVSSLVSSFLRIGDVPPIILE